MASRLPGARSRCSRSTWRSSNDSMPAMFGPAAAAPGTGWPPSSLITISRPRPKCGPQRKSTGCGVETVCSESWTSRVTINRSSCGAGLLPVAVNGDFPDELPAHQPADLRPAEVQGRVELEHRPAGGFEDDRLAEPLGLVFRRAVVEEDDGARMDFDPPVGEVAVLLKEQHGAVALQDRRVLQFPRVGRKERPDRVRSAGRPDPPAAWRIAAAIPPWARGRGPGGSAGGSIQGTASSAYAQ